jgi:hypothetical protein
MRALALCLAVMVVASCSTGMSPQELEAASNAQESLRGGIGTYDDVITVHTDSARGVVCYSSFNNRGTALSCVRVR